ncbi:MAG TPA: hypothetical protein VH951_01045 [Dehalococcoidia bacterium]
MVLLREEAAEGGANDSAGALGDDADVTMAAPVVVIAGDVVVEKK